MRVENPPEDIRKLYILFWIDHRNNMRFSGKYWFHIWISFLQQLPIKCSRKSLYRVFLFYLNYNLNCSMVKSQGDIVTSMLCHQLPVLNTYIQYTVLYSIIQYSISWARWKFPFLIGLKNWNSWNDKWFRHVHSCSV